MLNDAANALPKLKPTEIHTIKPGPAVDATASISSILLPLSFIAFLTISRLKQLMMMSLKKYVAGFTLALSGKKTLLCPKVHIF